MIRLEDLRKEKGLDVGKRLSSSYIKIPFRFNTKFTRKVNMSEKVATLKC